MHQLVMRRPHLRDLPPVPPLPAGYVLRAAAGERDAAALAAVLTAAFDDAWTADRVRRTLTEAPDVKAVYVVEWQGRPVATASSHWLPDRFPGAGVVHWVGTRPDHARLGLGSALLRRLLHDFDERGYPAAVLQTDTFRLPAIRAYLRFGFLPVYGSTGATTRTAGRPCSRRCSTGGSRARRDRKTPQLCDRWPVRDGGGPSIGRTGLPTGLTAG